jgi:hypothetical protein
MAGGANNQDAGLVERRFDSVLSAARQYRTSIPIDHISELMPVCGPNGPGEVTEWLAAHPTVGSLVGDRVVAGPLPPEPESAERRARGRRFFEEADGAARASLTPVAGIVRCLAVTGSAAYGEPAAHDDLDFLVVTRRGSVWPFLLYTYLAARMRRDRPGSDGPSHWCFNYVLDDRAARREFAQPRGFLFAREALTARPVSGEPYYRGLVGSATWLKDEVPRLYTRWSLNGLPPLPKEDPAPLGVRLLNVALYPLLAAYLTFGAMVRNRRLTRSGRVAKRFRVDARLDRLTYETERFEALRTLYTPADTVAGTRAS